MKRTIKAVFALSFAATVATAQDTNFAVRISCDFQQQAGAAELPDLTLLQGSAPMIQAAPMRMGRAVAADSLTTCQLVFGPSSTSTYYVATNAYLATNSAYYVQLGTIGTNSVPAGSNAPAAWWYSLLFYRNGGIYWSGSGRLYIERTTATGTNGLVWQEWEAGAAKDDIARGWIALLSNELANVEAGGVSYGTTSNTAARGDWFASVSADVASVKSSISTGKVDSSLFAVETERRIGADTAISNTLAIYATGKLNAATAAATYQPLGNYATGTPIYAETDSIALAAIPTNAECVGGWLNPDAFTLAPAAFTAASNVTDESYTTNAEYVARLVTLDGASAWRMNPSILRQSDTNGTPIAWAVTSAANAATFSNDAVYFNGATGATVAGTLGAWTISTQMTAVISPPVVQTQAYSAVAGTVRARIDGVLRPGIEAGKTNVVMVGMTGNTNLEPVLAGLAWNTNCWLTTNQPTCVSWSNSGYAASYRCALITSNAVLAARHWGPYAGDTLMFMDSTGGHHRATVFNGWHPSPTNIDMKILFLSPALPSSVRPVKFLPDNYTSYINDEFHLPVMFFDKFYRASVGFMRAGGMEATPYAYVDAPPYEPWNAYYRTPVSGDSGNPVLLPFGGDNFALLTLWYSAGHGPNYIQFRNNVVSGLVAFGAAYTNIQYVDFEAMGFSPL